jgi:signal transduction histidine kinase
LRRVIENLISNAAKYGSPTGPITLTLEKRASEIDISVHNVGNPLPREELLQLFDPFHRSSTADASPHVGWGLGLTLVRGVAEAHGGRVHVESTPEAGTTFTLSLPLDSRPFQLG